MALQFLLDEHVSPDVARAVRQMRTDTRALAIRDWRGGAYLGVGDEFVLAAAKEDHLTLVTYDRRSLVPLLVRLALAGSHHGGVVFVAERTIAPDDVGALARALTAVWDALHSVDWTDRVIYLAR